MDSQLFCVPRSQYLWLRNPPTLQCEISWFRYLTRFAKNMPSQLFPDLATFKMRSHFSWFRNFVYRLIPGWESRSENLTLKNRIVAKPWKLRIHGTPRPFLAPETLLKRLPNKNPIEKTITLRKEYFQEGNLDLNHWDWVSETEYTGKNFKFVRWIIIFSNSWNS